MAYYRSVGDDPAEAAHPAPRAGRRAVLRGADGGGGLLLGLLAAVPPGHPVGDRATRRVGAARPVDRRPTTRCCPGTCGCTTCSPARTAGSAPTPSPAGGWCSATPTSGSPTSSRPRPSPLYRNAIGDECVYVEAGAARGRDGLRRADRRGPGDYVIIPRATTHRWMPDRGRAAAGVRDRGQLPHRAAQALPVAVRAAARARARTASGTCTGRPSRCSSRAPTSRSTSSTAATDRAASSASATSSPAPPVRRRRLGRLPLPVHVQRRRLRADHRPGAPAAAGAPGVRGHELRHLQLRAAQGRLPPAGDPGAVLPLQRRHRRGHVLLRRRLRGAQGLGHRPGLDHRCTPAATRHGPQPGAVEASLGKEYFDELAVMVDTFRPLELGEGGRAGRRRRATPGAGIVPCGTDPRWRIRGRPGGRDGGYLRVRAGS